MAGPARLPGAGTSVDSRLRHIPGKMRGEGLETSGQIARLAAIDGVEGEGVAAAHHVPRDLPLAHLYPLRRDLPGGVVFEPLVVQHRDPDALRFRERLDRLHLESAFALGFSHLPGA